MNASDIQIGRSYYLVHRGRRVPVNVLSKDNGKYLVSFLSTGTLKKVSASALKDSSIPNRGGRKLKKTKLQRMNASAKKRKEARVSKALAAYVRAELGKVGKYTGAQAKRNGRRITINLV